jgi:hypothetical protein
MSPPHANDADELVTSDDPLHVNEPPTFECRGTALINTLFWTRTAQPANLIPELCRGFYHLGWVTGTGGGISIRVK